ncbi:hypothetical protein BC332_07183 [Capsicum chinense]|nr:hypothetical protein BC332_07183 [Capsicum chinense]
MQLIGNSVKELKEGLIPEDECSYRSELDDIIEKKLMFKIMVKESNINKYDEVYKVIMFVEDKVLFKEYNHPSLTYTESLFEGGQNYGGDELFEEALSSTLAGKKTRMRCINPRLAERYLNQRWLRSSVMQGMIPRVKPFLLTGMPPSWVRSMLISTPN